MQPVSNLMLLRRLRTSDTRPVAILNPEPPENPDGVPRYGCAGCRHLVLAGVSLAELKERTSKRDLAIRCPECGMLNGAEVSPGPSQSSLSRPEKPYGRRRTRLADWSGGAGRG